MKVTSLRYLDAKFHHPSPKIKKIPKNTNGRLAIPALAGLLVSRGGARAGGGGRNIKSVTDFIFQSRCFKKIDQSMMAVSRVVAFVALTEKSLANSLRRLLFQV